MNNRKTREQRRKAWVNAAICIGVVIALFATTTIVCARADRLTAEADKELSEEHRLYLAAQEPGAPQTWDELAAAMEEGAEVPFEEELNEAALLERATKIENVTVSHYCICKRCCGKDESHPAYGITASGRRAMPGTSIAVDPEVIPMGATVIADYGDGALHYYRADDTGAVIKGAHRIDLCVEDHETALQMGLKTATIWVVYEEEK